MILSYFRIYLYKKILKYQLQEEEVENEVGDKCLDCRKNTLSPQDKVKRTRSRKHLPCHAKGMLLTWQRKGRHCFQHSKKMSKAHIKTMYFISLQVCCFSLTSEEKGGESCYKSLVTLWEKTLKAKSQVYRQMKIHYFTPAVAQLNCLLQKIHSRVYFSFTRITINLDLRLIKSLYNAVTSLNNQ